MGIIETGIQKTRGQAWLIKLMKDADKYWNELESPSVNSIRKNKAICDYVCKCYKSGSSLRQLAKRFSVSHETIRAILIEYDIIMEKVNQHPPARLGDKRIGQGYIEVYVGRGYPGVPRKTGWMREHRLIMQEQLGRPIEPWEVVHHRDRNKLNNSIDNLEIISRCDHPTCLRCPYYQFWEDNHEELDFD